MSRPILDMSVLPNGISSTIPSPYDQGYAIISPTITSPSLGGMMTGPIQGPSFGPTKQLFNLYSLDQSQALFVRIEPKADKGFFRSNDNKDWICYRRNYFAASAAFSIVNEMGEPYLMPCLLETSEGVLVNVTQFSISIKAKTVDGEKEIPIIQQTPKRDKGPQMIPQPHVVRPGGSPYSHINTRDRLAIFERLQFKLATANNGRRRMGVQQYYKLTMELHATLENGENLTLASIDSCSLVVRGRSPNHYLDIDIPNKRVSNMMSTPLMSATMSPSTSLASLSLLRNPQIHPQSPTTSGSMFTFTHMASPPTTGGPASPNRAPGFTPMQFLGSPTPLDSSPMSPTRLVSDFPPHLIPQDESAPLSRQRSETISSLNSAVSLDDLCEYPSALGFQEMMYGTDAKNLAFQKDMANSNSELQSIDALPYPQVSFQSPSLMSPAAISDFGGFF